jgi:hypothetical protein
MDDAQITDEIEALEAEERALRREEEQAGDAGRADVVARDAERLEEIRVRRHQLEDLRRQRDARRRAGQDPADAQLRDPGTVEGYLG